MWLRFFQGSHGANYCLRELFDALRVELRLESLDLLIGGKQFEIGLGRDLGLLTALHNLQAGADSGLTPLLLLFLGIRRFQILGIQRHF